MNRTKSNLELKFISILMLISLVFVLFPPITSAANPTHKASITGAGDPNYLSSARRHHIDGDYAYVAGRNDNALTVFDISDIANGNITHKAVISGDGSPNYLQNVEDVYVSGDYAYLTAYGDSALTAIDISDIANGNLTHKASITGSGDPNYLGGTISVYVSGDYVYVANYTNDALSVFDISDIANGNITHKAAITGADLLPFLDGARAVYVTGDYAYVVSVIDDSLSVFDISDIANGNITLKVSVSGSGTYYIDSPKDVYVSGDYAYIASAGIDTLSVLDISDVANGNITYKARINGAGSPNYLNSAYGVYVSGDYAYTVSEIDDSLSVFDISDIANGNITLDGAITGAGDPNYLNFPIGVSRSGPYVYVTSLSDSALTVFQHGNAAPIVGHTSSNVLGTVTQDTDGTGNVNIPFRIQDIEADDCTTLGWQYSDDGGTTWNDLVAGDMTDEDGSKSSATDWSGTEHTIVWSSQNQIDDADQDDIQFAFTVNDGTVDSDAAATSTSFSVDNLDPSVSTYSPADDATGITISDNLVITFDEAVDVESGNITIYQTSDDSTVETIDITGDAVSGTGSTTITINPTSDLDYETEFYVFVDATTLDDATSNSYAGITASTTWSFTTEDTPDCSTIENAATYNAYPTCGVATCNSRYTLSGSTCVLSGGGGAAPVAPASGSGSSNTSIGMGQTGTIGNINSEGTNVLTYINSQVVFNTIVSGSSISESHNLSVTDLDTISKKITLTIESEPIQISLDVGETKQVDLNNDGMPDVEVKYVELVINRVELTITDLIIGDSLVENNYESQLVKYSNSPKVYLVQNNKKKWIINEETFNSLGYNWDDITIILDTHIYTDGEDIKIKESSAYIFKRSMNLGHKGSEVRELQIKLKQLGYFIYDHITGYFGPITESAVKKFQLATGIINSERDYGAGYVGPITKAKLNSF